MRGGGGLKVEASLVGFLARFKFEKSGTEKKEFQISNISSNELYDINSRIPILDLKFLKNGNLACGFSERTIKILSMNSLKFIYSIKAHNRSLLALSLLNNGDLVSSSADKTIKIWNTDLFYNISIINY